MWYRFVPAGGTCAISPVEDITSQNKITKSNRKSTEFIFTVIYRFIINGKRCRNLLLWYSIAEDEATRLVIFSFCRLVFLMFTSCFMLVPSIALLRSSRSSA